MRLKAILSIFILVNMIFFGGFAKDTTHITDFNHVNGSTTLKLSSSTNPLWNYTSEEEFYYKNVDISADGMSIVTLGIFNNTESTISLFHKPSPNPIWNYTMDGFGTSAISSDGNFIVAGNSEGKIFLFHKSSNTPRWIYNGGTNEDINSLAISSNGTYIVAGCTNSKVILFNNVSQIPIYVYPTEVSIPLQGTAICVDITPNGKYFVAGDNFGNLYLFDKSSDCAMWNYSIPGSDPPNNMTHVVEVSISSDGNNICMGTTTPSKIYYFVRNNSMPVWTYSTNASIHSIAISSDGNNIVAGTNIFDERYEYADWRSWVDYNLYFFNNYSSKPLWTYRTNFSINTVEISESGNIIAVLSQSRSSDSIHYLESTLHLFTSDSTEIWNYQLDRNPYGRGSLSISEDGKYIVAASINTLYLFDRDIVFAPQITINSPRNNDNFGVSAPDYDITITDLYSAIWYTIDGGITNFTTESLNGTIEQTEWDKKEEGIVIIRFYVNNSIGLIGEAQVQVIKDIPPESSPKILGYSLFLLLGICSAIILILIQRQKANYT